MNGPYHSIWLERQRCSGCELFAGGSAWSNSLWRECNLRKRHVASESSKSFSFRVGGGDFLVTLLTSCMAGAFSFGDGILSFPFHITHFVSSSIPKEKQKIIGQLWIINLESFDRPNRIPASSSWTVIFKLASFRAGLNSFTSQACGETIWQHVATVLAYHGGRRAPRTARWQRILLDQVWIGRGGCH